MRLLILALCTCAVIAAEPILERDLWYVGTIGDAPAATMHVTVHRADDGSRHALAATRIVIARKLGDHSVTISVSETQEFHEDASGHLTSFRIDQDQDGSVTSAIGRVAGREVIATVARLGRTEEQRVPIPEGADLLGQQAGQDLLTRPDLAIGTELASSGVVLLSGRVAILSTTAELAEQRADGNRLFVMKTPIMPPFRALVDPRGDLAKLEINLGFLTLILQRSEGPVALAGAEISPTGLAKATGPMPRPIAVNRYRIGAEALAQLPSDAFQTVADGVITIHSEGHEDPGDAQQYLVREPQFETDDPELRAWVGEISAAPTANQAELAERLRVAVRTRISNKDLAMADGSALEAFRTQSGDCTEHANLLTAALRIAGIPARTEVGVVYAAPYGGWVGHAWNSALVDGQWVHLDSAYPGILRSLYLKLACTTGPDAITTAGALANALIALAGQEIEYLPAD